MGLAALAPGTDGLESRRKRMNVGGDYSAEILKGVESKNLSSTFSVIRDTSLSRLFHSSEVAQAMDPVDQTAPLPGVSKKTMSARTRLFFSPSRFLVVVIYSSPLRRPPTPVFSEVARIIVFGGDPRP